MILKRKIYNDLLKWKNDRQGRSALLIEGARRIGKSFIVKEFGKNEYKSCLVIDFSLLSNELKSIFENDILNFDIFFMKLSVLFNTKLYVRQSLIVFDEVQKFPPARQLIKHLVADGRYDYIETGSLITLKKNVEDIVIPSEEEHLSMYPLDFEEFLWALDNTVMMPYIKECYNNLKPLGQGLHRKAMNLFREYMIVGGMPQAILEYTKSHDFEKVEFEKKQILTLYRQDISKFAKGYEARVNAVFDGIPSQLSHCEKKYNISSLNKNQRYRDYEDAFVWLQDAKVVNVCFNSNEPTVALSLNSERTTLKCYMADTGLLISLAIDCNLSSVNEVIKAILFDKINLNEGMFMENIVAQMLTCAGHKLYFYSRYDKENAENKMEIDFLIVKGKKVCPIEVKSSKNFKHSSLDKFSSKFKKEIGTKYILCDKDVHEKNGYLFLPLYMASLL